MSATPPSSTAEKTTLTPMEKLLQQMASQSGANEPDEAVASSHPFSPDSEALTRLKEGNSLSRDVGRILETTMKDPGVGGDIRLHDPEMVRFTEQPIVVEHNDRQVNVRPHEDGTVSLFLDRDPEASRDDTTFREAYSGSEDPSLFSYHKFALVSDPEGGFRQANLARVNRSASFLQPSYDPPNETGRAQAQLMQEVLSKGSISYGGRPVNAEAPAPKQPAPF